MALDGEPFPSSSETRFHHAEVGFLRSPVQFAEINNAKTC